MPAQLQQTDPSRRSWSREEYQRLEEWGFFKDQKVELVEGEIILQDPEDHKGAGLLYPSGRPHERLWTVEEFYRLGELGFFEGQKAELLEGEIVVSSPQKWPHASGLEKVAEVLKDALGKGFWVRTQLPLDLGLAILPEPDVSVVKGKRQDYSAHPTTALLIVEVSEATLGTDRDRKGSLYARAGLADYWIVNLVDEQLEVYRNPVSDSTQRYAWSYGNQFILRRGEVVTPLAAPKVVILVADLLP
jgi:Uma2 family endonuclease